MRESGFRFRAASSGTPNPHSVASIDRAIHSVRLKLCYFMDQLVVPPQCVFNLDETAVQVLSSEKKGWAKVGFSRVLKFPYLAWNLDHTNPRKREF